MNQRNKIGVNDFILECWGIDDAGWKFRLVSDEWWEVTAISESLGTFQETSWLYNDAEETLALMLDKIRKAKESSAGTD